MTSNAAGSATLKNRQIRNLRNNRLFLQTNKLDSARRGKETTSDSDAEFDREIEAAHSTQLKQDFAAFIQENDSLPSSRMSTPRKLRDSIQMASQTNFNLYERAKGFRDTDCKRLSVEDQEIIENALPCPHDPE